MYVSFCTHLRWRWNYFDLLNSFQLPACLYVWLSVCVPVPWKANPNQTVNHANLYNLFIYILNYGTGVLTTSVNFKFQHIHDWQKRVTYNSKSLSSDWKYNTSYKSNPKNQQNRILHTHTSHKNYCCKCFAILRFAICHDPRNCSIWDVIFAQSL